MPLNILVLVAGGEAGEDSYPLCLKELSGAPVIEKLCARLAALDKNLFFVFLKNEMEKFHLDKIVSLLNAEANSIAVPEYTKGSACTALFAAVQLPQDNPLLILSANELINMDFSMILADFDKRKLDAGTIIFDSVHPRYSFVRLDENGYVIEAAQQKPISNNATAGFFWFCKTGEFVSATKSMIRKDARTEGNFYVAPVFNELILKHRKIGVVKVPTEDYLPLKDESQQRRAGIRSM
ncbi:MAG: hypothetical protein NC112_08675 [Oxalobacter formigenes]|nr:hypothetical protein [Oxalobacter formigenes]